MSIYNLYLYDEIGNKYKRKNLYLNEVAVIQEKIANSQGEEKSKLKDILKDLIKNKDKHEYNVRLEGFKAEEKFFLKNLNREKEKFKTTLENEKNKKIKSLKLKLFISERTYGFYKNYTSLSYEAEMKSKENKITNEGLRDIIKSLEANEVKLNNLKKESKNIDKIKESEAKQEFHKYKIEQKQILKSGKKELKEKRRKGLISKKARTNETFQLEKEYKNNIHLKTLESPKRENKELIKNIKYSMKNNTKEKLNVLRANIADVRRKTPVELEKTNPKLAYLTLLFPGLGQIFNKQYTKGSLLLLLNVFIYLGAIPYALGYGNYQGDGIYGLISLAQDGLRIQQSLIFMIEGIIAIFLVVISIFLIFASFKDVLKVEKGKIKGVRENNWFETKSNLKEEGFPYVVSLPAFIIIIFIVLVPIATTILLSFTGMDPTHQSKFGWVGIANYKLIVLGKGLAGSVFWLILGWTIIWTLVATSLAIFIGFTLALLVNNERVRFKGFFRTIYLLPWAVPAFITIMFFSIMFSPSGALSQIIESLVGIRVEVKNNTNLTRIALIALQGWLGSAYVFLLSTGVLQAIPKDLYEAAEIDGATSWQKTKRITIPLVLFQTAPLLVTQYTFNFNNFSIIHLFNGGGPFNPKLYGNLAGSSDLLISYIYKLTIENQYQAIGAAITVFISMGLMFFAFLGFRNSQGFKEGEL